MPFLTQSKGAGSCQASPRGHAQFPFLLNKKNTSGKSRILLFTLMPSASYSHPALYPRGTMLPTSQIEHHRLGFAHNFFQSFFKPIHSSTGHILSMSSSVLAPDIWRHSGTLRELTAGSPTAGSWAFREAQDVTILLSVGDGGAEEMGSFTFLLILQLLPQEAQTHLVIFPF